MLGKITLKKYLLNEWFGDPEGYRIKIIGDMAKVPKEKLFKAEFRTN